MDAEELKKVLTKRLPRHLHRDITLITNTLIEVSSKSATPDDITTQQKTLLKAVSAILEGENLNVEQAVISFGTGLQSGDITFRDVAAGNITTININLLSHSLHQPPQLSHHLIPQKIQMPSMDESSFLNNYPQGGLVLESRTWRTVKLAPGKPLTIAIINQDTAFAGNMAYLIKDSFKRAIVHTFKNINTQQVSLILRDNDIDIVFLSDRLTETGPFSGYELLRTILQIDSRIICIFAIYQSDIHNRYHIMKDLGADAILLIPFDYDELEAVIKDATS